MSSDDTNAPNAQSSAWVMIALLLIVLVSVFVITLSNPITETAPRPTPIPAPEGYALVWHDEFDGPEIDPANWTYDIGGNGWGNAEWEYYTDHPENAYIEDGMLVIEARDESFMGRPYTSARLKTQGLQEWAYGRFEARIKIPYGQGIWPAVWMLGNDINKVSWPLAGEIDILENIGKEPNRLHGTVHGPGYSGGNGVTGHVDFEQPLSSDFHIYAIEWDENEIRWYLDDNHYQTFTKADIPGDWVFDHPFFLIMNVAVGGRWPGYPDDTTVFPQQMRVDYVRVFQQE
jgi:beta-glucanase (GH16 family)